MIYLLFIYNDIFTVYIQRHIYCLYTMTYLLFVYNDIFTVSIQ